MTRRTSTTTPSPCRAQFIVTLLQVTLLLPHPGPAVTATAEPPALQTLDALLRDIQVLVDDLGHTRHYNLEQPIRRKRQPRPLFSFWLQHRRSAQSQDPLPIAFDDEDTIAGQPADAGHGGGDHGRQQRLQELISGIRRLQLWEAALLRRFGDRFLDKPEKLTMNPLWMKVMKLRVMLHQLMQMAASEARGLDTTRMKK